MLLSIISPLTSTQKHARRVSNYLTFCCNGLPKSRIMRLNLHDAITFLFLITECTKNYHWKTSLTLTKNPAAKASNSVIIFSYKEDYDVLNILTLFKSILRSVCIFSSNFKVHGISNLLLSPRKTDFPVQKLPLGIIYRFTRRWKEYKNF